MKLSKKHLSASEIRKVAFIMLDMRGCEMWVNNNFHIKNRPFFGRRGSSDLLGFVRSTGIIVACEVKTVNDRLSEDQKSFLLSILQAGGFAYLAVEDKSGSVILKPYADEIKSPEY